MIKNKNKAKATTEHVSCHCKCKFTSPAYNSDQKWNNKTCQCECKNCCTCKRDYSLNPGTCICENSKNSNSHRICSVDSITGLQVVSHHTTHPKIYKLEFGD